MTVNDLFLAISVRFEAIIFWFTDGFGKLLDFDIMNLTIGQALFTLVIVGMGFFSEKEDKKWYQK